MISKGFHIVVQEHRLNAWKCLARWPLFVPCLLQSSSPDRPDSNTSGKLWMLLTIHPHMYQEMTVGTYGFKCLAPENRSSTGLVLKSDPGSPEKTHPRGDVKPEPATRLKAASLGSSPGGPVNPKPPVSQGTKPALAARPTIPLKPRTASNRSIGIFSLFSLQRICPSVWIFTFP